MTARDRNPHPFKDIVTRLQQDLDALIATTKSTPRSSSSARRQFDTSVRDLMTRMEAMLRDLDPVRHPDFIFDPSNPAVVGRFIALVMIAQEQVSLPEVG